VDWLFVFSCAAHNLLRLPGLIAQRQTAKLQEHVPEGRSRPLGSIPGGRKRRIDTAQSSISNRFSSRNHSKLQRRCVARRFFNKFLEQNQSKYAVLGVCDDIASGNSNSGFANSFFALRRFIGSDPRITSATRHRADDEQRPVFSLDEGAAYIFPMSPRANRLIAENKVERTGYSPSRNGM